MSTKIPWCDVTWNISVGCSPVSAGCQNCYAARFASRGLTAAHRGLAKDGRWTGKVRCLPERLEQPLRWRKPKRIFVCSMSDLFHESVPDEFIDRVFAVMALCPQHTFQVLTKRPDRMASYCSQRYLPGRIWDAHIMAGGSSGECDWPLPNVWLGVTAENQEMADERIPLLLQTPAAVRFVSCEPLLEETDIRKWLNGWCPFCGGDGLEGYFPTSGELRNGKFGGRHICPSCRRAQPTFPTVIREIRGEKLTFNAIDWVIAGGESGPGARPCDVEWIRSIRDQCREAGMACFVKQLGSNAIEGENQIYHCSNTKGADPAEWPEPLRVQEFPA